MRQFNGGKVKQGSHETDTASDHRNPSPATGKRSFNPLLGSARIAGIYFIVGCLWILLTDRAVSALVTSPGWIEEINMIKGWFFVFTTALLVFILILRQLKQIKRMEENLEATYREMAHSHEELEAAYEEIIATEEELRQQYDQLTDNQQMLAESERKMEYLAYHDALTDLPNKLALYEHAASSFLADTSQRAALLILDIDNFKYINDTLGHEFGDRLIIKASERLLSILGGEGKLYRFGGDDFIILLEPLPDPSCIDVFISGILAGFKESIDMGGSQLHISFSIGISLYPDHGSHIMELVKRADIAMYKAKEKGSGRFVVFDHPLNDIFAERMNIEKQLYAAMERNEFELVYQPQADMSLNQVTGFEALLRWKSPVLGYVSPLKFIKIAEDSHLIIPLGAWVLRNACAFLKSLHERGCSHLTISVNISMPQLMQKDFNDLVFRTLESCGLKPGSLELEITESVLVESYELIGPKLDALRDQGVKIALDDFGTGYSSLSYLTHLPISTLKIDKSFIDFIPHRTNQAILVEQIIMIGRRLNMAVVAEGVEQHDQLEYLLKHGCERIQGYYFSRPLKPEDIPGWLARWEEEHLPH
ncbi:EAL domain-containing protein [Paenibacillus sp. HN-1]|uniref:putative bifunctional diguanylate cyclase/phosphodiesterase n=1 Tax=Paenibacillus TaxID=44249 RepID=UPI001CA9900A|nr:MULTISPECIES: EAL domain-containing protein [Paenibacillus]MBY9077907.1 EAL domain-containing protein [Paenibacillus sp. CGMCC 1.18879]MBY9088137.1 EAL domain-containing protein [Paenibacillus sinensis]